MSPDQLTTPIKNIFSSLDTSIFKEYLEKYILVSPDTVTTPKKIIFFKKSDDWIIIWGVVLPMCQAATTSTMENMSFTYINFDLAYFRK